MLEEIVFSARITEIKEKNVKIDLIMNDQMDVKNARFDSDGRLQRRIRSGTGLAELLRQGGRWIRFRGQFCRFLRHGFVIETGGWKRCKRKF
jgi:hypothetical protein